MIGGLFYDIPGYVLKEHFDARLTHYNQRIEETAAQIRRVSLYDAVYGCDAVEKYKIRIRAFTFRSTHINPSEIYRLTETELRELEMLP